MPTWLYENLYVNNSGLKGYWASTSFDVNSRSAWIVGFTGNLFSYNVDNDSDIGVRSVITISKSQLG